MWDFKKRWDNQTLFLLHSSDIWSTSSHADICRCGPQTADLLHLKKQTSPKCVFGADYFVLITQVSSLTT
ncbi:hypothetical protein Hanom_Chr16g01436141 [Helianthus anomalus]